MRYYKLPKKVQEKIEYLYSGDKKPIIGLFRQAGDFKLMDKAPDSSYYSYYINVEGRKFMISIDFSEGYISMHNYERIFAKKTF